jgi:hypothetical protein
VGVERAGQADGLRTHGTDTVVQDLDEFVDRPDAETK